MSHTDDLTSDARWPIYGPGAAALGFRSELAVRVLDDPSASIAINLYSRERAAFRHPEEAARVLVGYAHGCSSGDSGPRVAAVMVSVGTRWCRPSAPGPAVSTRTGP